MPLPSQIFAKLEQNDRVKQAVVVQTGGIQVRTVAVEERDPDTGLLYARDDRGVRRQVADLSAGSSLGRVGPAILIDGATGVINS